MRHQVKAQDHRASYQTRRHRQHHPLHQYPQTEFLNGAKEDVPVSPFTVIFEMTHGQVGWKQKAISFLITM